MDTSDDEERKNWLHEGEALLLDHGKHVCLMDNYGWDAVDSKAAEPLASDSGNKIRTKKAIKESKQL